MAKANGQRIVSKGNKQEVELEKYIRTLPNYDVGVEFVKFFLLTVELQL